MAARRPAARGPRPGAAGRQSGGTARSGARAGKAASGEAQRPGRDMSEVLGQYEARRAIEVCAAGGHNLSLLGPPGVGKTMIAERLPTILPRLTPPGRPGGHVHPLGGGALPAGSELISEPPFCAPHHTATMPAIVGGGSNSVIRPGAASLAHRGVLFLDEAPEFRRDVLDALRQPLEAGEVVIARQGIITRFPARFTLVLAANPCPCAKADSGGAGCDCSAGGPAPVPRTAIRAAAGPGGREGSPGSGEPDGHARRPGGRREQRRRGRAVSRRRATVPASRLLDTPWQVNAEIPGAELRKSLALPPGALDLLDRAMELGQVSARGADKIIRVTWSLADLAGKPRPDGAGVQRGDRPVAGGAPVNHPRGGRSAGERESARMRRSPGRP